MTGPEFRDALKRIGWRQIDFARACDLHRNTVHGWADTGPPEWAARYLESLIALAELHQRFVVDPPRVRRESGEDEPDPEGRAARMAARLAGMKGED